MNEDFENSRRKKINEHRSQLISQMEQGKMKKDIETYNELMEESD